MPQTPIYYRVVMTLASPILLAAAWLQARSTANAPALWERLGRYQSPAPCRHWIHCASVGEVNTAKPLIEALSHQSHGTVVTVFTPTGAARALAVLPEHVHVVLAPLDTAAACRRFFAAYRPDIGLIVETEIWPQMLATGAASGTRLAIVNARLSAKSRSAPNWIKALQRNAASNLNRVLARNQQDADAWVELGAENAIVSVAGNLKFAALPPADHTPDRLCERRYWLAASTHADEERDIALAWCRHPKRHNTLLVIAPRHINRTPAIQSTLEANGLRTARFSDDVTDNGSIDVLIADTFGDLQAWYHHAEAVFVGGSLAPVGGHNVLEPAIAAKWIACGKNLHNFEDEVALLSSNRAIVLVDSPAELIDNVGDALENPSDTLEQGQRARASVQTVSGVLEAYLDAISEL